MQWTKNLFIKILLLSCKIITCARTVEITGEEACSNDIQPKHRSEKVATANGQVGDTYGAFCKVEVSWFLLLTSYSWLVLAGGMNQNTGHCSSGKVLLL